MNNGYNYTIYFNIIWPHILGLVPLYRSQIINALFYSQYFPGWVANSTQNQSLRGSFSYYLNYNSLPCCSTNQVVLSYDLGINMKDPFITFLFQYTLFRFNTQFAGTSFFSSINNQSGFQRDVVKLFSKNPNEDIEFENTDCSKPNHKFCFTRDDNIKVPLKITINFAPQKDDCFSSEFQDLIKKYLNSELQITGFIASIGAERTMSVTIGSNISNIEPKKIISEEGGYHEKKSNFNSLNFIHSTQNPKRDILNTNYFFTEIKDLFYKREFIKFKKAYFLLIEDYPTKMFITDEVDEDDEFRRNKELSQVVLKIYIIESEDDKLYFFNELSYVSNFDSNTIGYFYRNDMKELVSINDFYERLTVNTTITTREYNLVELYV